jgi:tetratricopeptide (TPR) repeat protein
VSYLKLFVVMLGLGLLLRPTFICAAPKALSPRSLSALMDQGHQALLAKEYKAARDDFSDIIYADPRNQLALDGATFAYLELDDFAHAKTCYERLQTVSSIPSRPSAINGAAIYLHFKMSMRSIKILMQYMKPMPQVDELALNALAISINQADDHARKATLYSEGVTFYIAKNKKLEATRPGEKRWGTEWLPADEADKKNAAWLEKINSTSSQAVELASLKAQYDAGEKAPGPLVFDADLGKYRTWHTNEWQLKRLQTQIDTMQAELDKAQASVERPPIPDEITPLSVVADNAPQVASASDRKSSSQPQAPQPSETPAPAPATLPAVALVPPVPSPTPAPADPGANKPAAPDTEIPAKKPIVSQPMRRPFPSRPTCWSPPPMRSPMHRTFKFRTPMALRFRPRWFARIPTPDWRWFALSIPSLAVSRWLINFPAARSPVSAFPTSISSSPPPH